MPTKKKTLSHKDLLDILAILEKLDSTPFDDTAVGDIQISKIRRATDKILGILGQKDDESKPLTFGSSDSIRSAAVAYLKRLLR